MADVPELTAPHARAAPEVVTALRTDSERGLGSIPVNLSPDALDFLAEMSDGDARRALTALEIGVRSIEARPVEFTLQPYEIRWVELSP